MKCIDLDQYGLHVINFSDVFHVAYKDIVDDLLLYDKYTDLNIRSQDTKRIYYYYMIKHLCDTIKHTKTNNRIVVFYSEKDIKCNFAQCTNKRTRKGGQRDNRDDFVLFMSRFFKHFKSMIPIRTYISNVKFNTFVQYYNTNKGKYIEIINSLRKDHDSSRKNMEKLKKFADKYKLTYINDAYINNVRMKGALYK